jgi:hypothetical protein
MGVRAQINVFGAYLGLRCDWRRQGGVGRWAAWARRVTCLGLRSCSADVGWLGQLSGVRVGVTGEGLCCGWARMFLGLWPRLRARVGLGLAVLIA